MNLDNKKVIAALLDTETYGTVIYASLLSMYPDLNDLDSLEIYAKLQSDLGVVMPEENENKLQAIISAVNTTYFYYDVEVFVSVCKSLVNGDPGLDDIDLNDISILEVLWGIYEIALNEDDRSDAEFSPSIQLFIDSVVKETAYDSEDLEEDEVIPTYEEVMLIHILRLKKQLEDIGFTNVVMPKFGE